MTRRHLRHYEVRGHALRDRRATGEGAAVCECGETSEVLPSARRRHRWHRDHRLALLFGDVPWCPA